MRFVRWLAAAGMTLLIVGCEQPGPVISPVAQTNQTGSSDSAVEAPAELDTDISATTPDPGASTAEPDKPTTEKLTTEKLTDPPEADTSPKQQNESNQKSNSEPAERTDSTKPKQEPTVTKPKATKPKATKKARPRATVDITFDTIKFEMEKEQQYEPQMLTDGIKELRGKKIRIRGYMLPSFTQTGITEFVLVRDNMECCFGPGAMIYDCIIVNMVNGTSAEFDVRPITVEGTFDIEELRIDGQLLGLYHMKATSAK